VSRGVELRDAARRLFGETGAAAAPELAAAAPELDASAPDPYVMARLLEDGDRADLAWLRGQLPAGALAAWVERHGARRLSRRSLAFWAAVLDRPDLRPELLPELARRLQLWPL
jgi:hypothetical protein